MIVATLNLQAIKNNLAAARISTYEQASINLEQALVLYQWNAQVSSSFFPCLQMCEVIIRNAVAEALTHAHGNDWAWQDGFYRSLPSNQKETLSKARQRTNNINDVIPELNFVFWQNMFTSRHDRLWSKLLLPTFPNLNHIHSIESTRAELYQSLETIRKLRNRIAHHEPIFKRNLESDYQIILKLIHFRCQDTAVWLEQYQTVIQTIKLRP